MGVSERKLSELNQKLESLTREFGYWRDESEAFQPLQKHHTQIRRITCQLEGMQQGIRKQLEALRQGPVVDIFSGVRRLELDILEVHRIWEFFRSKFVLRGVDWFSPYLVAADEFAFASYSIAQQSFNYVNITPDDLKQPPLVFFNGGSSPYTLARHLAYQAEPVVGEELKSIESSALLKELPIPVIGIPWFQVQHLPDALVIGHEVGHDVEEDFQLTTRIKALLDDAMQKAKIDPTHWPAWNAWLRELFADLYGCLITGPAFVESLFDFLAADKTVTETDLREDPAWGNYPPDYLRMLINLAALDVQGFKDEAEKLKQDLENTYTTHAMKDFEKDIPPIITALIDEPYPEFKNKSLRQIVGFTKMNHENAKADSERLLLGNAPATNNIRVLLASARLAYGNDSEKYKEKKAHNLILERVPATQAQGVRGTRYGQRDKTKAEIAATDAFDRSEGEKLFEKLKRKTEGA